MICRNFKIISLAPKIRRLLSPRFFNLAGINLCRRKSESFSVGQCGHKPGRWPTGKKVNFKFHSETEALFNQQINAEFKAFYYYLSMVRFYQRYFIFF